LPWEQNIDSFDHKSVYKGKKIIIRKDISFASSMWLKGPSSRTDICVTVPQISKLTRLGIYGPINNAKVV
jgi:hypothetical protein